MGIKEKNNLAGVSLKAGAWYVVSSVLVKAAIFLSTPVFTRILSTEEYGITSTFTSWFSLLLPVCTLNLTYSIGRAKIDFGEKLDDYIGAMMSLAAIITLAISAIIFLFFDSVVSMMNMPPVIVALLLIYLFFSPAVTFTQNGFRYRYEYKKNILIAGYTAIGTIAFSLFLLYFVDGDKVILRITGVVIPNVTLSLLFWLGAIKNHHLKLNHGFWKYGIMISAPLIVHTVSLNILSQSDRILISGICGSKDTGIYSLIYMYGLFLSVVTNAVADSWLPWFHDSFHAGHYDDIRRNVKDVVRLGCYIGLASVAIAPEAITILGGDSYIGGIICVPAVVSGIICQYIYTHYVNIELHMKKTKYVAVGTLIAAVINILLNIIFIPAYGYAAAAYTTFFSYLILMGIHYAITQKILKVKIYDDCFMFSSVAATAFIAFMMEGLYDYFLVRLFLVFIGFLSFIWVFRKYIAKVLNYLGGCR